MNIIKYYTDYVNSINEGLIKTHDSKISFNEMIRSLRLLKFNVDGEFSSDEIVLIINDFSHIQKDKIDDFFDHISVTLTNRFGWFPSTMSITIGDNIRQKKYDESELKLKHDLISTVRIAFNSKFDETCDVPSKLYHLSIQEYERKILKYGIVPKSNSKLSFHLDRIYLCKTKKDCHELIPQMKLHYSEEKDTNLYMIGNKKWRKNTKWIIYEISSTEIKTLYKDPNYLNGYYTLDNISPSSIEVVDREK